MFDVMFANNQQALTDVYLAGDKLPLQFQGSYVVLATIVSVVGAWTSMVLCKRAPSLCFAACLNIA